MVEGGPKKSKSGIKAEGKIEQKEKRMKVSLVESTKKKQASHFLELRERHQYSDERSSRIRALCVASIAAGTEGRRPNGQVVRIERTAERRRQRSREIID